MTTKQMKMIFQVVSDGGAGADVVINCNGQEVFNGTLENTVTQFVELQNIDIDTTPNREVVFNIDVPTFDKAQSYQSQITNLVTSITCSNGELLLQRTGANWSPWYTENLSDPAKFDFHQGTVDEFVTCNIPVAPTYNGTAHPEMYNIAENYGKTGPGVIPITSEVTVTHAVPPFNNS